MIYCLMNTGGKIMTEETRELLLRKAQEMVHSGKKRLKVKSPDCDGVIWTEFKHGSMGTISGVEFQAEVVLSTGETTVTYLVRSFDLEDDRASWSVGNLAEAERIEKAAALSEQERRKLN